MRLLRSGFEILDRRPLAPLQNRLRIDPVAPAQLRGRSLRSLYCSSDCVRRGAPVTNLAHSASLHSMEKIAPIKLWDQTPSGSEPDRQQPAPRVLSVNPSGTRVCVRRTGRKRS